MQLLEPLLCYFEKLKPLSFQNCMYKKTAKHDNNTIIKQTIGQISRGRYKISNRKCKVRILFKGKKRTVLLTDSIPSLDFWGSISGLSNYERSFKILDEWLNIEISTKNSNLLTALKKYQEKYCLLGCELKNEFFYKLYSIKEFSTSRRNLYHTIWIDYEKQLKKGNQIYDDSQVNGLFAFSQEGFMKNIDQRTLNSNYIVLNTSPKENFGSHLFILKTVPDCKYFYDGVEIIGDRFKVISKYDLNSCEDNKRLCKKLL